MNRYRFELATSDDDAAIRAFLRSTSMPGRIELGFLREPSYFAPGGRFGPLQQTIVCRDAAPADPARDETASEIVGLASRSVREVHLDGQHCQVGYLSMLRSAERVRSGMLLARGYRYLKQLHQDGAAPCYLTTIADGNDVALDILTSNRAGLPRYRPAGRYLTFAIATRPKFEFPGRRLARKSEHVPTTVDSVGSINSINSAGPVGYEEIVSFLASHGKSRQFYPVISRADFDRTDAGDSELGGASTPQPGTTFAGIGLDDVAVRRNASGHVIATMALWDQRPFRQTVVHGYDPLLTRVRPAYNATARLHRRPLLPAPGETLAEGYVALTAVEGEDLDLADGLLVEILQKARARGMGYVLFGCHEDDPLASVAKHRSFLTYTTHTFVVTWPEFGPEPPYDPTVPIHLEVGCL